MCPARLRAVRLPEPALVRPSRAELRGELGEPDGSACSILSSSWAPELELRGSGEQAVACYVTVQYRVRTSE